MCRGSESIGFSVRSRLSLLPLLLVGLPAVLAAFQTAPPEAGGEAFRVVPFLAPFHSVVLHFPIGFIVVLGLLEIYHLRRPSADIRNMTFILAALAVGSCFMAASLGWLRGAGGGYDAETLELHRWSGIAVTGLSLANLGVLARARRRAESEAIWKLYRGLLVVTTAVVVFAGHQGGNLTHGSKYLLRNAPDFVKAYWATPGDAARRIDEPEKYYLREIMPIFDAKCKRCHGETAHMSGYRLDLQEDAFAGGDSGLPAIVPGDPAGSHLLYVILLSRDHEEAMPPDGLNEVSSQETARIIDWIRDGAPYVSDADAFMPLLEK